MEQRERIEIPVRGMGCASCARHVEQAIAGVDGVYSVEVLLSSERAVVEVEPGRRIEREVIRRAVQSAGYEVPEPEGEEATSYREVANRVFIVFGLVVGVVLLVAVAGEWLGVFASVEERVPWGVGALIVLVIGWPVFRRVVQAALRGKVISHTVMALGAVAALAVGEWATAAVVVFFMRVGDYVEQFTTHKARSSVRELTRRAPQKARIESVGEEQEMPVEEVRPGDVIIVRPGEQIPVDGEVIGGQATINQAAITGESMPVEAGPGTRVFAASFAQFGALRIRATAVGRDSTFGRIVRLVEEAEASRGPVQRLADRFSAYYLPIVAAIAILTYVLRGDILAAVAVTVVACSCAFALATPVALLASVGAAAREGLVVKGGKYLETLAKADVVLLDKTGTLTMGAPVITDVLVLNGMSEDEILKLAASAERYSEHPLAAAVREAATSQGLRLDEPERFEALPGEGVRAVVGGREVFVGRQQGATSGSDEEALRTQGKTLFTVEIDGRVAGMLAAADMVRPDVPDAIRALRGMGIAHIELLTGDRTETARALAEDLEIAYRAELLPEDKIEVVRSYQAEGRTVVMIGDGINDAPALAQADVSIAMGAAGTTVAMEVASIALMRNDWCAVPEVFRIARRTMGVIRLNIGFTAAYNVVGLTLAVLGMLPPVLAAAAQSLPDVGILANSARLLRR